MEDTNNRDDLIENDDNNVNDNIDSEDHDSDDEEGGYHLFDESHYNYGKLDTIEKLKENSPSITGLDIELSRNVSKCFFNSFDWKKDGYCVSNNTHLKRLLINHNDGRLHAQRYFLGEQGHSLPTRQQLQDFFSCIYRNSSIMELKLRGIDVSDEFGGDLIEGLAGHPSLTTLEISKGRTLFKALGKVLNHEKSILKDFCLPGCGDEGLGALCDVLVGNSTLKKLDLGDNDTITSVGWRALSTVIQHPNCKLIELDLHNTGINDEGADILGSALSGSSLKVLNLGWSYMRRHSISSEGWQTLFGQLSQTPIQNLNLESNQIDDSDLAKLATIGTLKSLGLKGMKSSTPAGWSSFFHSLQRRGTQLVKLDISRNCIGDVGIQALGSLLSNTSTLRTLMMFTMLNTEWSGCSITAQGWIALFNLLQDSNLGLTKLSLDSNNIEDEELPLLVRTLSNMSSLRCLSLSRNDLVTPTGWLALSDYLQSPNLFIKKT